MTPEMIERICRLNACLTEASIWTEDRARRTLAAYFAGGGSEMEEWQQLGDYWEDYELEAVIKCSIGNNDPAFNPDEEYANMIAATETRMTNMQHESKDDEFSGTYNWNEGLPDIDAFRRTRFCWLFHDIFDHTLHRDLDALMRIGELEINLVLTRQCGVSLDTALLPRKRKSSYPRSVFSQTPCSGKYNPLTYRELRYARLLNQKMSEARAWIEEQARRSEKEYADMGGLDRHIMEGNAYEDYELLMEVCGCLGENHPEHDEHEDGIVVRYSESIYKENQRVFGRSRNPFHHNRYHYAFAPAAHHGRWRDELNKIQPCGLFWDIFKNTEHDWLKMLSIGQLWLDVFFVQRRIVHV